MNNTLANAIPLVEARAKASWHEGARELFVESALSDNTIPLVVDVVMAGQRCYAVRWRSQTGEVKDFPILYSFDRNADVLYIPPQYVNVTFVGLMSELLRAHPSHFGGCVDGDPIVVYLVSHDAGEGGRLFRQVSPLVHPVDKGVEHIPESMDIFGCTDSLGLVGRTWHGYTSVKHGVYVPSGDCTYGLARVRELAINTYANQQYWLEQQRQIQSAE